MAEGDNATCFVGAAHISHSVDTILLVGEGFVYVSTFVAEETPVLYLVSLR